jgi:hypothetical protein
MAPDVPGLLQAAALDDDRKIQPQGQVVAARKPYS